MSARSKSSDTTTKRTFSKGSFNKQGSQKKRRKDAWIKPFFKQYRGALILALFLGVMTFAFASALMFDAGYMISRSAEVRGNLLTIFVPSILARVFGVGKPFLHYFERLTSHNWVLRMTSKLRLKLYKVLEKDAIFIRQRYRTGDILGLLAEDLGHIQNLYLRTIFPYIIAWTLYVVIVILLGLFSPWFALVMLLLLGVVVVLLPLVSALANGARQARRKVMRNELYEHLTDNVMGVSDWIIAQRGDEYVHTHRSSEAAVRSIDKEMNRSSRNRNLLLQVLYGAIAVSLLLWAGNHFGGFFAGLGNWIAAFVLGFFPLIDAFAPLPDAAIEFSKYRDSIDRLNELPPEQEQEVFQHAHETIAAPYTVNIREVSFRYPQAPRDLIDGLDLSITPGEKLAILGRSGSGKSTLAALIRGDLSPINGSVSINGIPTHTLGDRIADYIGVIQQQTYLFNATLAENLRIGNQAATDEELWKALDDVGLSQMAQRLPKGLETLVDEAGLRFSGGERHRVALARILLQRVPIVILDEPTVGLDPVSEHALLNTIFETMKDKTIIMITHHLQGVSQMDRVIFIEDGNLKLNGSPEELSKENSYYQRLEAFDKGTYS